MNRKIIFSILALAGTLLAGCNNISQPSEVNQTPPSNQVENQTTQNDTIENKSIEATSMMETVGELSAEENSKYKNDLSLEQKLKLAEELTMKMPKNGMKQMMSLFPDMEKTQDIADKDPKNMMMMGPESWYYSKEGNITVAICNATNSPMHIFKGNNPSLEDIEEAKMIIKEMISEHEMQMAGNGTKMTEKAAYLDYSEDLYASLLGKKPFALFFHASWCPTCRAMEKDITEGLNSFPDGTRIIKTNFDTATELKQKYGIVSQSIIVVLNAKGEVVEKLVAPDNDTLKEAIKKSF